MQNGPVQGAPFAIHAENLVGDHDVIVQLRIPITRVIVPERGVDQPSRHVFGPHTVLPTPCEYRVGFQVHHRVLDRRMMSLLNGGLDVAVAHAPEVGDALGGGEHHVVSGDRVGPFMGLAGDELGELFLILGLAPMQLVEVLPTGFGTDDAAFISGRFAVLQAGEVTHGCGDFLGQGCIELVETLVALTELRLNLRTGLRVNLPREGVLSQSVEQFHLLFSDRAGHA